MNELKEYILTHKRAVLIGTAGLAILGTIAALICTVFIKAPQGAEPVPEGRIYDAGVFGDDVTIYCLLFCALLCAGGICHRRFQVHRANSQILVQAGRVPGYAAAHQCVVYQAVPQLYAGV